MHQLGSKIMSPNQDLDHYITKVYELRDKLKHIGESFSEARIMDLILEGLTDDYQQIRFAVERDPDISFKQIAPSASHAGAVRRHAEGGTSQL